MAQVFRVERNKNFTVMSNHHFKNKDLSLKAKGLLSLMLSLPEDWNYLDNKSKMTRISQYELVLHKDNPVILVRKSSAKENVTPCTARERIPSL